MKDKENEMTIEEVTKQLTALEEKQELITKRAEAAEAIVAMPLAERMVFDELSKEDQTKYLAGDADVKKSVADKISKSSDDDEEDEPEIPEAVSKRFDEITKRAEAAEARAAKAEEIAKAERESRELVECSKRAEKEFNNLPGTSDEKGAVLKMLKTKLTADEVTKVEALLTAGNAALATVTTEVGKSGAGSSNNSNDPLTKLEKMADEIVTKSNGKITFGKAYNQALDTPEGKKLYEESLTKK